MLDLKRYPGQPVLDSFTLSGAEELASRIRRYWKDRGLFPDVRVEKIKAERVGHVAVVRSDMVGGQPRRRTSAIAA